MNILTEVKETLKALPNLTSGEIVDLMPGYRPQQVYNAVSRLRQYGDIVISATERGQRPGGAAIIVNRYSLNSDPNFKPQRRQMRNSTPTTTGYAAQISDLKKQIAELEEWKASALTRYPDLAVPPIVLRARIIVADELAAGGDATLAAQVRRGEKDSSLMMRVTIKALEEGE